MVTTCKWRFQSKIGLAILFSPSLSPKSRNIVQDDNRSRWILEFLLLVTWETWQWTCQYGYPDVEFEEIWTLFCFRCNKFVCNACFFSDNPCSLTIPYILFLHRDRNVFCLSGESERLQTFIFFVPFVCLLWNSETPNLPVLQLHDLQLFSIVVVHG